jgi:hypothetical protein
MIHRLNVRIGQICHVDVVPTRGAVGREVIVAEQVQSAARPSSGIKWQEVPWYSRQRPENVSTNIWSVLYFPSGAYKITAQLTTTRYGRR